MADVVEVYPCVLLAKRLLVLRRFEQAITVCCEGLERAGDGHRSSRNNAMYVCFYCESKTADVIIPRWHVLMFQP